MCLGGENCVSAEHVCESAQTRVYVCTDTCVQSLQTDICVQRSVCMHTLSVRLSIGIHANKLFG